MIESGRESIARYLRKQNLPLQRLMTVDSLTAVAADLRYQDIESLFAAIGEGHISAQAVVTRLLHSMGGEEGAEEDLAEATMPSEVPTRRRRAGDPGVVVKGGVKLRRNLTGTRPRYAGAAAAQGIQSRQPTHAT